MKQNLSINNLLKPYNDSGLYNHYQLLQLKAGLKDNLDISIYANPNISWEQMEKIRINLRNYETKPIHYQSLKTL